MGNIFAGSEVVELGIQIEKNGRDFYSLLAKKAKGAKSKELFHYLSGEEEKHIQVFQDILNKVSQYEPTDSYPGEYFSYMNALASEYIFTKANKGEEVAKNVTTDQEAVNLGIGFEKDSVIFYEGMKKVVPSYDIKIIDELILQEQEHLRQLTELKKILV